MNDNEDVLTTSQKVLTINSDARKYGTFVALHVKSDKMLGRERETFTAQAA